MSEVIFAPVELLPGGRWGHGRLELGSAPVAGDISSPFGAWEQWRQDAGLGPHRGVDIAASEGTPIRCPAPGRVISIAPWDGLPFATTQTDLGNFLVIDHAFGVRTIYAHLMETPTFLIGSDIAAGATLGKIGQTGKATGSHLHWVCRVGVQLVDPLSLAFPREPVGMIERIGLASAILQRKAHPFLDERMADGTRIYTVERAP